MAIQDGRVLHPVEIRAGANIRADAIKNFGALASFPDYEVGFGSVIC